MNPDYIPTVFVAQFLTPNQFCLFDEIEAEAIDVLHESGSVFSRSSLQSETCKSVFFECARVGFVLSWSGLPEADVLTLAVGPRGDPKLPQEEALLSAAQLRELVHRCEALFEVERSVWQITSLPLTEDTVLNHDSRLAALYSSTFDEHTPFIALKADEQGSPTSPGLVARAQGLFKKVRASLNAANEEPSWAMQASALALSSTFVLVTPPVGIAMFTYAALRQGTDMDLLPRNLDMKNWPLAEGISAHVASRVNKRGLRVSIVAD